MSNEKNNVNNNSEAPAPPLRELIKNRLDKAAELRANNVNPYPYKYEWSHRIPELIEDFDILSEKVQSVSIAGRLMLIRKMGKTFFADLQDSWGKIQIYVRKDKVGDELFEIFNKCDLGDIIGCEGILFTTKMGEKTLKVEKFEFLSKAIHPLPDKHAGLTDTEMRYRRRYADLIVNPEVRDVFRMRSKIIQEVRNYLDNQGFLEVETPVLQPLYGGGNAKPFKTYYNKLERDMYMRIADELYLKRLIVGGYDKVWEFCKDFRNEGLDRFHNPEFSMIELYWAYADYKDIGELFENLIRHVVFKIHGKYKIPYGDVEIDFEPKFKWVSMIDSLAEATGVNFLDLSHEEAKTKAKEIWPTIDESNLINWGKIVESLWEEKVEATLIQPTFITDHPTDISPLAKKHRDDPRLTERFELFVNGSELGNAFSELNDPVDQLERFLQQGKAIAAGDDEGHPLDDDYITALAYGMPPTGGLGFGVDRLVMFLTNQHTIRDVVFFPQMKEAAENTIQVSKIISQIVENDK